MRWQYGGSGRADRDAQRQGLAVMGVPPDQIDAMLPARHADSMQLPPLLLPVWQVWLDMDAYWRVSDGVILGLDVCALDVVHRQRGTSRRVQREMWPLIKAMEREALRLIRSKT